MHGFALYFSNRQCHTLGNLYFDYKLPNNRVQCILYLSVHSMACTLFICFNMDFFLIVLILLHVLLWLILSLTSSHPSLPRTDLSYILDRKQWMLPKGYEIYTRLVPPPEMILLGPRGRQSTSKEVIRFAPEMWKLVSFLIKLHSYIYY